MSAPFIFFTKKILICDAFVDDDVSNQTCDDSCHTTSENCIVVNIASKSTSDQSNSSRQD